MNDKNLAMSDKNQRPHQAVELDDSQVFVVHSQVVNCAQGTRAGTILAGILDFLASRFFSSIRLSLIH
jgi:hypothetical protein